MSTETKQDVSGMLKTVLACITSGDAKINKMAEQCILKSINRNATSTFKTISGWVEWAINKSIDADIPASLYEEITVQADKLATFITTSDLTPYEDEPQEEAEVAPTNRMKSNGVFVPPVPLTKDQVLKDPMRFMSAPHDVVNDFREEAAKQQYDDMVSDVNNLTARVKTLESAMSTASTVEMGEFNPPVPEVDRDFIVSKEHKKLWKAVNNAANIRGMSCVLAQGDPSSGKSKAAEQFAAATNRKFFSINCSTVREAEQWFVTMQERDGKTFFEPSAFVKAISMGGVVVRLEELNRLDPIIQNPLLELLQDRRTYIDQLGEVRIGLDTVFIATANIGTQYQGTFRMCESLLSRFKIRAIFQPLTEANMTKVLVSRTGVDQDFAKNLSKVVKQVQSKSGIVGTGSYDKPITYRQAEECCFLWPELGKDAIEHTILNHFDADGPESDRSKALTLFAGVSLM